MELISFGGTQLSRPGSYSVVDVKQSTPYTPGSLKVLAAIGSGASGQPGVPLYFNNPTIASQKIGGTDALLLAQIAWEHGADLICVSLTDVAAQATYDIKSTDTTPITLATLKGQRWNTADNLVQVQVAAAASGAQTVTFTDTSVSPYVTETFTLTNTAQGITNFINDVHNKSTLLDAVAGPGGSTTNVAATVSGTDLAGGSRSAGTSASISAAIDALKTEDIQGIMSSLTDSTSQSAIQTHVDTMSNVDNKRERRAFLGQAIGTAVSAYQTAMASFDGRVTLAAPGHYKAVNGVKTLLSSAFTAAAVAGLWAGRTNPNDPITFKYIKALGLEFSYLNPDIKTLTQAQVTAIEAVPSRGFRVVHAMTGDKGGTNMVELSTADLVDIMVRATREQLEDRFVGKAGVNGVENDITQMTQTILESFKKQNWIVDGTDQYGQPQPAYRNITVTKSGTQFPVTFEISPVEPVNYITITTTVNA